MTLRNDVFYGFKIVEEPLKENSVYVVPDEDVQPVTRSFKRNYKCPENPPGSGNFKCDLPDEGSKDGSSSGEKKSKKPRTPEAKIAALDDKINRTRTQLDKILKARRNLPKAVTAEKGYTFSYAIKNTEEKLHTLERAKFKAGVVRVPRTYNPGNLTDCADPTGEFSKPIAVNKEILELSRGIFEQNKDYTTELGKFVRIRDTIQAEVQKRYPTFSDSESEKVANDVLMYHEPTVITNWARRMEKKVYSKKETAELWQYPLSYAKINGYLFSPKKFSSVKDEVEPKIKVLDAAMEKSSLPGPVTVFRGMSKGALKGSLQKKNLLEVGNVIEYKGFMSTTVNKDWAMEWSRTGDVLLEINLPKGANAAYRLDDDMSNTWTVPNEREVLVARGKKFKVTGVKDIDYPYIYDDTPDDIKQKIVEKYKGKFKVVTMEMVD
jgi:hypothetical protein